MNKLKIRLKNCIQTILELEPGMRNQGGNFFDEDFLFLKTYLRRIDNMELAEEDVAKMESVVADFLSDTAFERAWKNAKNRVLQ